MPRYPEESPESSSPIVTRAVAAGLKEKFCDNYLLPNWQKFLLRLLGSFPQKIGRSVVSNFQRLSGLNPDLLNDFSLEYLLNKRLDDYQDIKQKLPCITMGSALGGASAYLSLVLGGTFLPQAYVLSIKGGSYSGDVNVYLNRSLIQAIKICENNPQIISIQHYDPIHDGWLTRYVNHFRFKLISIPSAYKKYIQANLLPGGSLVYFECQARWLRYKVGPRSYFQVGGWGDISPQEYISGSNRIDSFAHKSGLKHSNWKLDIYQLEDGFESEWGSEPGLAESVEMFCKVEGYKFIKISLNHPSDFSKLAFETALNNLQINNQQPGGVLIETFSQFDSTSAIRAGLLPLWLIYNTKDNLRFLKTMIQRFPNDKPVFFSPLATFSLTPDMTSCDEWDQVLTGFNRINIGTRPSHYPADTKAIVDWSEPLRKWVVNNPNPISTINPLDLYEISLKI